MTRVPLSRVPAPPLEGKDLKKISDEEILEAWNSAVLDKRQIYDDHPHLIKITSGAIMKMDLSIEVEVANMEEVYKTSSVRVPRLYRTLSNGHAEYFIMEYIDGECLDNVE